MRRLILRRGPVIKEWFESLLTPATKEARRLGYLYETIALKSRYRRNRAEWRNHVEQCRRHTLAAAEGARSVAILGSGPLLEIPMEELAARFERILLVDFVHPRDVRAKWGKHPKVELIEKDLLDIAGGLLRWKDGPLPEPKPPRVEADFILSANCLSQLCLKPRRFLEGKIPAAELDAYSEKLSQAHLDSLRGSRHLVITDFESRVLNPRGEVTERTAPFFDLAKLKKMDSWNWRLAPPGEIYRRSSVEMTVGAFTVL